MKRLAFFTISLSLFSSCIGHRKITKSHLCKDFSFWIINSSVLTDEIFCQDTINFLSGSNYNEHDKIITNPTFYFKSFKIFKNKNATGKGKHDKNDFVISFSPIVDSLDKEKPTGVVYNPDINGRWRLGVFKTNQLILKKIKSEKVIKDCKEDNKKWRNKIVYSIVYLDKNKMILVRK